MLTVGLAVLQLHAFPKNPDIFKYTDATARADSHGNLFHFVNMQGTHLEDVYHSLLEPAARCWFC